MLKQGKKARLERGGLALSGRIDIFQFINLSSLLPSHSIAMEKRRATT